MKDQLREHIDEIQDLMAQTWKGIAISAGILSQVYDELSTEKAVSVDEIADKKDYDRVKLGKWLYLMENCGIVKKEGDKYLLTVKGSILSKNSPSKDTFGMFQLNRFYMEAAINSLQTFKKGRSLDKLGDGKIAVYYQPRVSDKFSEALANYIRNFNVQGTDSLFDAGCGRGNFLKIIASMIPEIRLTGMDSNKFAIENGKIEYRDLELSGRLNLMVGDITMELGSFEDNHFDWCTSINIFHFIPVEKRMQVIENMIRISKKGLFMTLVVLEKTPPARAADPLMFLLWNDYTGFFNAEEFENIISMIKEKYGNYSINIEPIMEGNSNLVTITK